MELPEYVSVAEVRRVCSELGLRDWAALASTDVLAEEAEVLRAEVGGETAEIPTEVFRRGLEIELEHGLRFPDANVTNNHPLLTARIVLAHLKETLDYYQRLEVAELEGDLLAAAHGGDGARAGRVYRRLAAARERLAASERMRFE